MLICSVCLPGQEGRRAGRGRRQQETGSGPHPSMGHAGLCGSVDTEERTEHPAGLSGGDRSSGDMEEMSLGPQLPCQESRQQGGPRGPLETLSLCPGEPHSGHQGQCRLSREKTVISVRTSVVAAA